MKKIILIFILLFFSSLTFSQSKIIFTIDNPTSIIKKPKYEFIDYEIPMKLVSIITGSFSGFKIMFSEDPNKIEFYEFIIMLPFDDKFFINKNDEDKCILVNGILPVEFTNDDFSQGVYDYRNDKYIYPIIGLQKYTRSENKLRISDKLEFKNFSLKFIDFWCESGKINVKAELNGSVYFSSEEYDAPYHIKATIEIINENLLKTFVD